MWLLALVFTLRQPAYESIMADENIDVEFYKCAELSACVYYHVFPMTPGQAGRAGSHDSVL